MGAIGGVKRAAGSWCCKCLGMKLPPVFLLLRLITRHLHLVIAPNLPVTSNHRRFPSAIRASRKHLFKRTRNNAPATRH